MGFISYYVEYETDGGEIVPIHIKYDEDTKHQERIDTGKFSVNTQNSFCNRLFNRQQLAPRSIEHVELKRKRSEGKENMVI